ncbi:hypothetical protein [Wolbachia endosymbiont (group A) of Icerya purchasi]|nr:hypothetical protein [Wolbachia endosymbiont (group A) of Icerya purchasi]
MTKKRSTGMTRRGHWNDKKGATWITGEGGYLNGNELEENVYD